MVSVFITLSCNSNNAGAPTSVPSGSAANSASKLAIDDNSRANDFDDAVSNVLRAFKNKDQKFMDSMFAGGRNVVVIYRNGVFNDYKEIDKINFANPFPENFSYPSPLSDLKLQYGKLPKFSCGTMEWDKTGLFCDTIHKDTLLSGVPQNLKKYRGDTIEELEITRLKQLEKNSRRIVLAGAGSKDLVFYLTRINNRWYLTALDRITTDCSA